jgi:hypothetical protein
MGYKLGKDCKAYVFTNVLTQKWDGTGAAPTHTEMPNVKDVTVNLETGEADITTRANNGWRATAATLKNGSVDFEMLWDASDPGFSKIQTAWSNSAEIGLAFMDGAIDGAGNSGLASNFTVTNFSRSEPLEEAVKVSVTVKPSSCTEWADVAGA